MFLNLRDGLSKSYDEEFNSLKNQADLTLHNAYEKMKGDPPSKIPFIIWLLENPDSPLPFAGKIDLYRHDCLHLLLKRSFSLYDEAFIIGFTMGNDLQTRWFHIILFKLISRTFYPLQFRFNSHHLIAFDLGYLYGSKVRSKNINKIDFQNYQHKSIQQIRQELGIDTYELQIMWESQNLLTQVWF